MACTGMKEYFLQSIQFVNLLRTNCTLLSPHIRRYATQYVLQFCISAQISRFPCYIVQLPAVHFPLTITDRTLYPPTVRTPSPLPLRAPSLKTSTRLFIPATPPIIPSVLPWMFQAGTTNSYALLNIMQLSSCHCLQSRNCVDTLICLFQYLSYPYSLLILSPIFLYVSIIQQLHSMLWVYRQIASDAAFVPTVRNIMPAFPTHRVYILSVHCCSSTLFAILSPVLAVGSGWHINMTNEPTESCDR